MGFRITRLRAAALGSIVAIAGVSIPAALVAATPSEPASLTSVQFAPVEVPPAPDGATPAFDSRVPASDRRDDSPSRAAKAAEIAKANRAAAPTRTAPRARAVTAVVRVIPKPKPEPKPASPTFAGGSSSARARVVAIALAQLNDRYVAGGVGPDTFDCSGLVRYAYEGAGVGSKLGGGHSSSAMLAWGRSEGLTSTSNGRIGDVVIYGNGSHAGIYIGNGKVVSALNASQGIQVTGLYALGSGFTAFIHTRI